MKKKILYIWYFIMKVKFTVLLSVVACVLLFQNCSELSFRSDPLSMTMVKYENRSSNKYIFLGHEGDDCHLLRHKRIHNFFFFFPLNTFSKEEIQEISQQKMIRYKNIMRLGDFAWTLVLLPVTILTYSIEVETCNTGMVAVTRRDPLYLDTIKNQKGEPKREDSVATSDAPANGNTKKTSPDIPKKSINPKPAPETKDIEQGTRKIAEKEKATNSEAASNAKVPSSGTKDANDTIDALISISDPKPIEVKRIVYPNQKKRASSENATPLVNPDLPSEEVWNNAVVRDETSESETKEPKEEFNPEIYKLDGTLPIIWNYKNSITNRLNENIKPFSILFPKNGVVLSPEEEKKLDAFANEYLESYGTSKILLIGHSEWADGKGVKLTLSQHRAECVRNYLILKNVPSDNILLTFSGGLWGEANESKFGKDFSRRVDIVFLY